MPYKVLIFDWEGTLGDTAAHLVDSLHLAVAELELPQPDPVIISNSLGKDLLTLIETLYPDQDRSVQARLKHQIHYHYYSKVAGPTLFPHTEDILKRLHAEGYLLAIATGKSRRGLDQALQTTQLAVLISSSRCADETASKPDPRMLEEILDELMMTPGAALMIGDSESDLELAKNAGMDAVLLTHSTADPEPAFSQPYAPKACLLDIVQFYEWLQQAAKI